jgi:hypothetical protein
LTNTQTRGLCHDKKSEPESLAEQSIAATDSSQNILPAGLGLHLANPTLPMTLDPSASSTTLPMAFDPLKSCSTTLPMTLDPLESFTTPAALDPSANSLLPAALDPSVCVNIRSIHSKEKLQKSSSLSAGLGLTSFNGKPYSTFRLIVGFKDQVNAFSSNAFPITKLRDAADFQ